MNCCPLKATCFQPSNTRSFIPAEGELNARMQRIVKEIQRVRPDRLVIEALSELRMLTKGPLRYGRQILSLRALAIASSDQRGHGASAERRQAAPMLEETRKLNRSCRLQHLHHVVPSASPLA